MLTKLKQRKNKNYLREKINYNICICFSAFYKTKLFSWILTLVNFASERNKTLFSGGTRREAWERPTPLFSYPPKGPRDKQTLLLPPPPPPTPYFKVRMIWAPYYLIFFCLLWFSILYSISSLLHQEFCVDHST